MLAMAAARDRGLDPEGGALLQEQADFTLESFREKVEPMREGRGVGGGAMTVGYGLWALHLAGRSRDEATDAMAAFLLKTQRPDGHWSTGNRPPMEESAVACTVLAALGIKRYAPDDRKEAARAAVERALAWLAAAPSRVQEDRSFRLIGLSLLGGNPGDIPAAMRAVAQGQHDDGGWPSRDDLPGDAYATGQALAAFRLAGMKADDPVYRRGVAWLLKTRRDDGSWKVETRSRPIQVYFDNGDPHGRHQFISTPATCWAVVALAGLLPSVAQAEKAAVEPYDLVIRGGRVVDGSGNPWFFGDVAIRGDRIAAVGRVPAGVPAKREIDARGLVVAPGFIDMHSHSDTPLLVDGAAMSKVTQGVTTEVLGEDTSGGPSKGKRPEKTFRRGGKTLHWSTLGGYLDAVEESGVAVNVASYVGLGSLLGCVLGDALDRPTSAQLEEIKALLDEALGEGAFGLSTMLAGARELNVTTDDLVALGRVVRRHGGIYSSHIRNEGTEVFTAVGEAIAVGERAGIPVDVIHIKIADQSLWGRMDEIVARIDAARARGVNVQSNVYPYTRGNNDLVSIIPPWAHEGGTSALLDRLKDPAQRARIKAEILKGLPGWYNHYTAVGGDWARMLISARLSEANARFQGKTMDVVLAERAKAAPANADPLDLFLDFLAEERGSVSTIYAHHTEADMNLALARPWCSIGSDGSALADTGPLRSGHPHPRSFGTFPRVLGVYVRQRHLLTLEDAVRKMTSLNAAKLGITDRGLLRAGMFADVTVFDPDAVTDRASYLEPFRYSDGIVHVIVNGQPVLDRGRPTGARPGRALRHRGSRPEASGS
jgi:N-acyl-D-aspartate/D-glutamate deacylase